VIVALRGIRSTASNLHRRRFLTKHPRKDGYAGEVNFSGVAFIQIGDLSMLEQQNDETTYLFVAIDAHIKRGGKVSRVTSGAEYERKALAGVGDIGTRQAGSEATIADGSRFAAAWGGRPPGRRLKAKHQASKAAMAALSNCFSLT
jgi:hypothetical protein